ncbi:MAG TPA: hypothetical protein VH088_15180 [Terriglobales bacterium]|nr:hypothetical protein [Terriglobales bacterium]
MKVGAENRNKLIAAVVLGVLAVIMLIRFIPTVLGSSPVPEVRATAQPPAPVHRPKTVRISKLKPGQKKALPAAEPSLDPLLRFDWLKASEDTTYSGSGRNIFKAEIEIPKPIAQVRQKAVAVVPQGPPPPPPPPPINLKFFGFASKPGEPKKIFLSQGEDIFIAGEGEIVDRRYKVMRITPTSVEIEDVLNNNRQMIPLQQG